MVQRGLMGVRARVPRVGHGETSHSYAQIWPGVNYGISPEGGVPHGYTPLVTARGQYHGGLNATRAGDLPNPMLRAPAWDSAEEKRAQEVGINSTKCAC